MKNEVSTCLEQTTSMMKMFEGKWVLLIMNSLIQGKKRFNEMVLELSITPRQLSQVLKRLETDKLIKRQVIDQRPVLVFYEATEMGLDFKGVIDALTKFANRWI